MFWMLIALFMVVVWILFFLTKYRPDDIFSSQLDRFYPACIIDFKVDYVVLQNHWTIIMTYAFGDEY